MPDNTPLKLAGSSFGKGLAVLAWVLEHHGARADEIAGALALPISTTYRYLRTLRALEFVADSDGAFSPGSRIPGHSDELPAARIGTVAAPFLQHLSEATGETALLTVRHGIHAICVRQVESTQQIRLAFRLGQLLPLYAGASQRVLLAYAPETIQRSVLESDLRSFTANTPARSELPRALARIRAEGIALSRGELTPGSVSLAAPVLRGAEAICALCVAGPQGRCGSAWQTAARRELTAAARSLAQTIAESETVQQ